ncbi:MAG: hypothetical protein Kow0092_24530 [Deferrisomatales bacterium]
MGVRRIAAWGIALAGLVALAGCTLPGYVRDPSPWVADTDWSQAEPVRLSMGEYRFSPEVLTFEAGKPYALRIDNTGQEPHVFGAGKFFRAVATRAAQVPDAAAFRAPYFTGLEVFPGHSVELYFVPVRPGTYELACTAPGHADQGMVGALRIVRKAPAQ